MDSYREIVDVDAPVDARSRVARPSRLRARLILLVAGSMLPLLLLVSAVVLQAYTSAQESAGDQVLRTTQSAMAAVDRELQNQIAGLQVLALSPALHNNDLKSFRTEAQRFLTRYPAGAGVSVADRSGQILLNTSAAPVQRLPTRSDPEGTKRIYTTKKPYVSDLRMGRISNRPIFTVSVPVIENGEVIYDLAFAPALSTFYEFLDEFNLPEGWIASIFDRNAHHIARKPSLGGTEITTASETLRKQMLLGNNRIVHTVSLEGVSNLSAFSRSDSTGWVVAIGMPLEALNGQVRQTLFFALGIGAALMLIGLGFASRLATNLLRAEAHRNLLVNELNHRVKNTLSSVQAIVARGLQDAPAAAEQKKAIDERLMALSHVHNILSNQNWESADFGDIARSVLEPFEMPQGRRIVIAGPPVRLPPHTAIALAMVLNELATNAVKYGALSVTTGIVHITWQGGEGNRLTIDWTESGGPPVHPPTRTGYGTRFIERAIGGELGGRYQAAYLPQGLVCVMDVAL